MDRLALVSSIGGFLAILVFIHFAVDWIFQSHAEAMVKHNQWKVRAKHCAIYTFPFIMFLSWCGLDYTETLLATMILFFSHFIEDTYIPVFMWTKYIRRPPELQTKIFHTILPEKLSIIYMGKKCPMVLGDIHYLVDGLPPFEEQIFYNYQDEITTLEQANKILEEEGFKKFVDSAMGKILMIAIDQIIHIGFLIPIAIILAYK